MKISAYKSLGSFIATFSKENTLPIDEEEATAELVNKENAAEEKAEDSTKLTDTENSEQIVEETVTEQTNEEITAKAPEQETTPEQTESNSPKKEGEYSNFIYWRNSIPTMDDQTPTETNDEKKNTENVIKLICVLSKIII